MIEAPEPSGGSTDDAILVMLVVIFLPLLVAHALAVMWGS